MFAAKYASESDKTYWLRLDTQLSESELDLKIRDKRGYIICDDDKPVGVMRYNLMYDTIPFLTTQKGHSRTSGRFSCRVE